MKLSISLIYNNDNHINSNDVNINKDNYIVGNILNELPFDANNDISSLPETYSISSLVYPNPFQDKIFINTSSSYFVTDIYGRMITYGNKSHFINTSEWMPGVYFISLNDQNKSTIKIVKLY